MLAHHGIPCGRNFPFRANWGDILLFCTPGLGSYVVKVGTASKWGHAALIIFDSNNKPTVCILVTSSYLFKLTYLKIFETTFLTGVRAVQNFDAFMMAFLKDGAKFCLRRLR